MAEKKEIFILLTHTGTIPSKIIRFYTREPYSHVSIAFDLDLNEIYSFGRRFVNNPIIAGLIKEDISGGTYAKFKNTTYELYSLSISSKQYYKLKSEVQSLYKVRDKYGYNFLGLLGIVVKRPISRRNAYFCSQFVATVLERSDIKIIKKPSGLVMPGDFRRAKGLRLVRKGILSKHKANINNIRYEMDMKISS